MTAIVPRPLLAALLLVLAACAGARRAPPGAAPGAPPAVSFPPDEVKVGPLDLELAGKNDEELFAIGTAASGAGDHARAAVAFSRLADRFPASRHAAAALLEAGLAYERREEWHLALERFSALARGHGGPEALEATFRTAECQYHLGDLRDARTTLDGLASRGDLPPGERVRAITQRGIVELEEGRSEDAERSLRLALSTYDAASEDERLEGHYAAQAQFYLGEVYREWFRALRFDPSRGDDEGLRRDVEHKAEMLLSAQGHYLRAIRMGSDRWAVAAGYRIGALYDELRAQLLDAPLPPGLDAEQAATYRDELRRQVRVLAAKAVTAYEQILARAARSGVEDLRFLAEAQASLDRLKQVMAEDPGPPGS